MEKGFTLKIGILVKSHYGVGLKTRTRSVECYQAISSVTGLNGRLDDLELYRNISIWTILKES